MAGRNQKQIEKQILYNLFRDHRISITFHKKTVGNIDFDTGAQSITTDDMTSRKCAIIPPTQKKEYSYVFNNFEYGGYSDENTILIIVQKKSLFTIESGDIKVYHEVDSTWWFEVDGKKYDVTQFGETTSGTAYLIKAKGQESNDGSE